MPKLRSCISKTNLCTGHKKKINTQGKSWLSVLLIIILPKCPLCVMAYSGAMTMCSGNMIYPNAGSESVYFLLVLSALVLLGIILNYKGRRTILAIIIALVGITNLLLSQIYWYSEVSYYLSVLIIISGIWFNGSLYHFIKHFENLIVKEKSKVQS